MAVKPEQTTSWRSPAASLGSTLHASFGNPAAIAALVLPVAPVVILAVLLPWLVPSSGAVLSDGALAVFDAPSWLVLAEAVLLALGAVALVFGAVAASSAVIADVAGTGRDVRRSWDSAARRAPGLIVVVAVLGLVVAVVALIAVGTAWLGVAWVGVVAGILAVLIAAPLATAPAMLLLGDSGPLRALSDAAAVVRWSGDELVARVRLSLAVGAGFGLPLAAWWARDLGGTVLSVFAADLLGAVAAAAGVLLAIAWTTTVALDARLRRHEPTHAPSSGTGRAPRAVLAASLAALLAVPGSVALLAAVNPSNLARVTTSEAGRHWEDLEVVPFGDGAALLSLIGDEGGIMSLCAEHPCAEYDDPGFAGQSVVSLGDGSVLWVRVQPMFEESSFRLSSIELSATRLESSDIPPSEDQGDSLPQEVWDTNLSVLWSEAVPEEQSGDSELWLDTATAVALDGAGNPVIALVTSMSRDRGLLKVFRCAAPDCSSSGEVAAVDILWQYPFAHAEWAMLGIAPLGADEFGVAVIHPHDGPAPLQYVLIGEGSDPVVQVLDGRPGAYERADGTAGVRVAVNGDGTATLAYRPHGSVDGYILTCADAACSEYDTEVMLRSGSDPYFPSPTLAIDDTGRPMYLERDEAGLISLVSCLDVSCAEVTSTAVALPEYPGGPMALALTSDGRPLIVAAAPAVDPNYQRRITERSLVVECVDARCGLR